VDEAVKLALESNPQLLSAKLRKEQLDDQSKSVRGHMLPVLNVNEEFQHYDKPFALSFPLGPPPFPSFTARQQDTNTFVVAAGQPLTGLLRLWQERNALESSQQSTDQLVQGGEAAIREAVETGYLRYFEAKATEDIAKTSEAELREQEQLAEVRLKAGVLTRADVLRLTVAEANARQQEIQAQAQEQITRAALLTAIGLTPQDTNVVFVEPQALENAPMPPLDEVEAQQRAFHKRPEAVAKLYDYNSAVYQSRSAFFALLPDINLEAAYINLQGSAFSPQNQIYAGVKATWNIWEWGATWYQYQAAGAAADAASQSAEQAGRDVRTDASTKLFQVRAAGAAVESAQAAIASAEESYRVSAELVRVGSATTTTELLDAQTALTQAKLNLVRARYEQAIATVALRRAIAE
jgi:outer membrane protein